MSTITAALSPEIQTPPRAHAVERWLSDDFSAPARQVPTNFSTLLRGVSQQALPLQGGSQAMVLNQSGHDVSVPIDSTDVRGANTIAYTLEPAPMSLRAEHSRDEQSVRASAEQLVASALLTPLLAEIEDSPLRPKSGPFAQSIGEKRFGPLLHQHLSDRIVHGRGFGLVDAVVDRMLGRNVEVRA